MSATTATPGQRAPHRERAAGTAHAFDRLGLRLRPVDVAVLEALWESPASTLEQLADRCGVSLAAARGCLQTLVDLRLALGEDGGYRALDPEASLNHVLARMESALRDRHDTVATAREDAMRIVSSYHRRRSAAAPRPAQAAARPPFLRRLAELLDEAHGEVALVLPAGRDADGRPAVLPVLDVVLARSPASVRALCPEAVAERPDARAAVEHAVARGLRVHVHAHPPAPMAVLGTTSACVAAAATGTDGRAHVVDDAGVVAALRELFDRCLDTARPWDGAEAPDELAHLTREVLRHLDAGHKDEVVARRVGLSIRTTRRIVADAAVRAGAQSRFQLGSRAARLGWLDPDGARRDDGAAP